jgi:hypothetical protein
MFQVANNVSSRLFPFDLAAKHTLFLPPAQNLGYWVSFQLCDYTRKRTETVAISDHGPSDLDYLRLARYSGIGIGSDKPTSHY